MLKPKIILSSDYAGFTELDEIEYWDRISEDYEHKIIKYSQLSWVHIWILSYRIYQNRIQSLMWERVPGYMQYRWPQR
jgi:hypothetical protein